MVGAFMDRVVGVYVMPQLGRYESALDVLQPAGFGPASQDVEKKKGFGVVKSGSSDSESFS